MSQGYQAALGIDTLLPVGRGVEFEQCAITKVSQIIDTSGIRGSRAHLAARTRCGVDTVSGVIELVPAADDLRHLLPWILGGAVVDGQYSLGESLGERFIQVDKVAGVFTYTGCLVNRAVFACRSGQPLRLRLEIVGKTETCGLAGSFPSVAYPGGPPFLFSDTILNLVGQSREVQEWSIVIDNHLEVSFANSTTATRIIPRDRTVTLNCTNPFTADEVALYDQSLAGSPASLSMTNSAATLVFQFATLQVPSAGPTIAGRHEVPLQLQGIARRVDAISELVVLVQ
ncbi:MAG: hypothetical protein JNM18_21440 [Planctomycetaceae bacterium]|nr:hypothetical protein [Planctomycetaceae bacterium]